MMLFSDSLLRRYTPPTCTLEIWGKRSLLSLWKTDKHLNDFTFKLHFDDPKKLDNEQVTLEGDRSELQLLCDIVITYVQNLLSISPSSLPFIGVGNEFPTAEKSFLPSSSYSLGAEYSTVANSKALELTKLDWVRELVPDEVTGDSVVGEGNISQLLKNSDLSIAPLPSLKPKGLLTHELDCSLLLTKDKQTKIQLSISQLFDLANALEEYTLEVEISPYFQTSKTDKKSFVWTMSALVALVAVGVPTVAIKFYNYTHQDTTLSDSSSSKSTTQEILPPVPLPPSNVPVPSPTLAPSLEQQKKLLPPSEVGQGTLSRNNGVAVVVPPKSFLPPAPVVPPAPQRNAIVLTPNLPPNPTYPTSATPSNLPAAPQRPNSVPTFSDNPPQSANTAYTMPNPTTVPTLPQLPKLSSQTATLPSQENQSQLTAMNLAEQAGNKANTALLDTIPQVTEAREYFQQRWQPPNNLKHTLEYRLVLNSDGSIGRIIPLGKAAKLYLDRTNMPLLGESFVSALPEDLENPQIRLVLSPDKSVKTFLEESQSQ